MSEVLVGELAQIASTASVAVIAFFSTTGVAKPVAS